MFIDQKTFVIEKVPSEQYYKSRFPRWNPKTKTNIPCVFHKGDTNPSLSINLRNGGARCFAASCEKSIGNIVHFESQVTKTTEDDAARALYDEFVRPIVPADLWQKFQTELKHDVRQRTFFTRVTGINPQTIDRFNIGYDSFSRRFTFPIRNQFNDVVNIRFYRPKAARSAKDVKIYSLVTNKGEDSEIRFGRNELFPWPMFRTYSTDKPLFFMASEKETILACQLNLQAICTTGGEGSWSEEWLELFEKYDIGIIFDPDKGGRAAAEKIVATLQPVAKNVLALELPFGHDYKGDKDFDDWIVSKNGNQFALLNLFSSKVEQSTSLVPLPSPVETEREKLLGDDWEVPRFFDNKRYDLGEIRSRTDLLNYRVNTRGIIAAVSSKSFDVPYKFKVKTKKGIAKLDLPIGRDLVSLVGSSDSDVTSTLSRTIGADVEEWKADTYVSISEVEVVPIVEVASDIEGRYTVQRCFVLGKSIESNTPYELIVIPTTLTKTQEKILIVVSAIETARMIDTWKVFDERQIALLETFKPAGNQSVSEKLTQVADEIAFNHSKIYDRTDWHIVALLSWVCPLGWYFPSESNLQRGWLNTLAIGDTQTGKSQVVATLQRLFKLGDIVNAENCTFVGLVGGAIKVGSGQMMLRWGKIPLCDKKLVIIEELSGLSVEEISNMSEVRSRGIARLDKGGLASQTPARTRLICLSNVRQMKKNLAQYLSGVKAIQELIGHPEDISRFDLIITLIDSEVSSDTINSPMDESVEATFTPEQLRKLCQFAWALKPNQIKFSDDAYMLCLEWTKKLQDIYHPSIPIFKAASGRLLLARIAAAIATLQFSWDGQMLTVEDKHVEATVDLLRGLYDKPSFGYLEYSRQMQDREVVKFIKELDLSVSKNIKADVLIPTFENLVHAAKFTRDELAAVGSMQLFQADDLVGHMLRSRVIRKGEANTWEITKAGQAWMNKIINERES